MNNFKAINKKNHIFIKYFLIMIIFLGSIFITFALFIKDKSEPTDKVQKSAVYKNKEYGFQLKMPDKWVKYIVKENKINENWTTFEIGLPLETNFISQWMSGEYKNGNFFRIITLDKMTISEFEKEKKKCDDYVKSGVNNGPCFRPFEITRNNEFVFGKSWYFTGGGWDPCLYEKNMEKDPKITEPYFCSVYKEIGWVDYLENNLTLIK